MKQKCYKKDTDRRLQKLILFLHKSLKIAPIQIGRNVYCDFKNECIFGVNYAKYKINDNLNIIIEASTASKTRLSLYFEVYGDCTNVVEIELYDITVIFDTFKNITAEDFILKYCDKSMLE